MPQMSPQGGDGNKEVQVSSQWDSLWKNLPMTLVWFKCNFIDLNLLSSPNAHIEIGSMRLIPRQPEL